jgi:hypothetical protein
MASTLVLLSSLALLGMAACSHSGAPAEDDPFSTHTRGTITEAPSRTGGYAFMIEERPEQPVGAEASPLTAGDKYHVAITPGTTIERRTASGEVRPATAEEISVGTQAEVWFTGPILESYPAQGTAGRVLIVDAPP